MAKQAKDLATRVKESGYAKSNVNTEMLRALRKVDLEKVKVREKAQQSQSKKKKQAIGDFKALL